MEQDIPALLETIAELRQQVADQAKGLTEWAQDSVALGLRMEAAESQVAALTTIVQKIQDFLWLLDVGTIITEHHWRETASLMVQLDEALSFKQAFAPVRKRKGGK